jgi:two-component system phosphate regulon sensor histidine kinase PhoR
MWSSRLFWKLYVSYAGLILAATALFAALISGRQRTQVEDHLRERLLDDAVLLRSHVVHFFGAEEHDELQRLVRRLSSETRIRVTIIDEGGRVLADSEQDPRQMENHRSRPEIEIAAREGVGAWTHVSRTLGIPMKYLALRVDRNDVSVGYVRVALPIRDVELRVAAVQRLVWGIGLAVCLAALIITYAVVAGLARPIQSLTAATQAIAGGEYSHRVRVASRDELGTLGDTFNRMADQLTQHVAQIREDRELLATVLGGMVEGVIAVDAQQRVVFANETARSMLGLTAANLAERPLWELVRHPALHETLEQAFAADQVCRREFDFGGSSRQSLVLLCRRLPGNPPSGAVLVLHDVTELRRLENLRREFVANVSHELKTPLASIKAYVETLLGGAIDDPENNVAFLRRIAEQADRLHRLIIDLLRLARVESGQEAFEIKSISLADVAATRAAEHEAVASAKQIKLQTLAGDEPIHVLADEEGLRTILDNLLDNAIKYTPDGGRVTVRWRAEGSMAVIEVEDTGIGIALHDQPRIFERFYRVDKARSRDLGGTGLGLSIVKHLVQAFGGTVSVSSALGRGSTFTVRLPLAP